MRAELLQLQAVFAYLHRELGSIIIQRQLQPCCPLLGLRLAGRAQCLHADAAARYLLNHEFLHS
ncbi:hypothetical protein D3C80_2163400 [compost metagenome]